MGVTNLGQTDCALTQPRNSVRKLPATVLLWQKSYCVVSTKQHRHLAEAAGESLLP